MNTEIYATLEIRKKELRVVVVRYRQGSTSVIFKEKIAGEWLSENDIVNDHKHAAQKFRRVIDSFEKTFNQKIQRVILVLPSKTLQILDKDDSMDLSDKAGISENVVTSMLEKIKNDNKTAGRQIVSIRPYSFKTQDGAESPYAPITIKSNYLLIRTKIYTVAAEVYTSHLGVLTAANLELLTITIDMFSIGKAIISEREFRNAQVVVNWGYDTIKVGFYAREALNKVISLNFGVAWIIKRMSEALSVKTRDIEKYLFKLIDCSKETFGSEELVFRKYSSTEQRSLVYNAQTMREYIYTEFKKCIDIIDDRIKTEIPLAIDYNVFYYGRVTEVTGFPDILMKSELYKRTKVYYSNMIGGNELWLTSAIGAVKQQRQANKNSTHTFKTSTGILDLTLHQNLGQTQVINQTKTIPTFNLKPNFNPQPNPVQYGMKPQAQYQTQNVTTMPPSPRGQFNPNQQWYPMPPSHYVPQPTNVQRQRVAEPNRNFNPNGMSNQPVQHPYQNQYQNQYQYQNQNSNQHQQNYGQNYYKNHNNS
ncbi:cell division protein FtsA [Spiroplasma clarkii]|uniref:Cell division protein FtsA n=1 Tax=Spiroplasma clarkii TaxID=2139 RepID=A0A1Y0L085_9MOLU|nr:hypothetical protein [Spiroplasma clarkii]ARU91406.1 cell division protein FtsA [Spiroplasma clarkii]ATX70822.1 cell division protein FtsA [Spiroplasma clarkii]